LGLTGVTASWPGELSSNDCDRIALATMETGIRKTVGSALTSMGTLSASPLAFVIVLIYAALWLVFERDTFDWHAVATLATWLMTLVIQRSEHRDTQAIHAKLDALLRAEDAADTGLAKLDDEEPEDVEEFRQHEKDRL